MASKREAQAFPTTALLVIATRISVQGGAELRGERHVLLEICLLLQVVNNFGPHLRHPILVLRDRRRVVMFD